MVIRDILPAFVRWVAGTPLSDVGNFVNFGQWLMQRSSRIGGCSHSLGNIMKDVCKDFPSYPSWLASLRALCRFFRMQGYRQHLVRVVRNPELNLEESSRSLLPVLQNGDRYETMVGCLKQWGGFELGKCSF